MLSANSCGTCVFKLVQQHNSKLRLLMIANVSLVNTIDMNGQANHWQSVDVKIGNGVLNSQPPP